MDATQLPGAVLVTLSMSTDADRARDVAASVVDPEIPVLTIADLGILREVTLEEGRPVVTITPTYSGCPAMTRIEADLRRALAAHGMPEAEVRLVHHPAWSSDWITDAGRAKLADFGIAPPSPVEAVFCPNCAAGPPRMVARFGSTACKALMVCTSCGEPFDLFKEF